MGSMTISREFLEKLGACSGGAIRAAITMLLSSKEAIYDKGHRHLMQTMGCQSSYCTRVVRELLDAEIITLTSGGRGKGKVTRYRVNY